MSKVEPNHKSVSTESIVDPALDVTKPQPQQEEMPFAVVQGQAQYTLPKDLYIPPDALEVFLDAFEGPLDLLLYLIKRQNLDILEIPLSAITTQYMGYIDMMEELRLELAAEYLVMAAMLAEIKSRMLLPRPVTEDGEEADPRAELIRRLQEYERFKQAADDINELSQMGKDNFQTEVAFPDKHTDHAPPDIEMKEMLLALRDVLHRADMFTKHQISKETLSLRERMSRVLETVKSESFVSFTKMFDLEEGREGIVVTFMAILELLKQALIEMVQTETYGDIHVKAAGGVSCEPA